MNYLLTCMLSCTTLLTLSFDKSWVFSSQSYEACLTSGFHRVYVCTYNYCFRHMQRCENFTPENTLVFVKSKIKAPEYVSRRVGMRKSSHNSLLIDIHVELSIDNWLIEHVHVQSCLLIISVSTNQLAILLIECSIANQSCAKCYLELPIH